MNVFPNPSTGATLRAQGLSVVIGARNVLDHVDVTFAAGRVSALCGPNGCGKSTLLRTLGGLLKPVLGRVWLDGTPLFLRLLSRTFLRSHAHVG